MTSWQQLMVAVALMGVASTAWSASLNFTGTAYDTDTNELLYIEQHTLTTNQSGLPVSEEVQYVDADNQVLGRKQLDYQTLIQPDYQAQYLTVDRLETVKLTDTLVKIGGFRPADLERPNPPFVIDAGFHYFIVQHFDKLLDGEKVTFEFLSAGRNLFISMVIEQQKREANRLVLKLKLKNFFFAALVDPIELEYQIDTRQLLRYEGLTNLPNAEGKLYSARIEYQYPENYNDQLNLSSLFTTKP